MARDKFSMILAAAEQRGSVNCHEVADMLGITPRKAVGKICQLVCTGRMERVPDSKPAKYRITTAPDPSRLILTGDLASIMGHIRRSGAAGISTAELCALMPKSSGTIWYSCRRLVAFGRAHMAMHDRIERRWFAAQEDAEAHQAGLADRLADIKAAADAATKRERAERQAMRDAKRLRVRKRRPAKPALSDAKRADWEQIRVSDAPVVIAERGPLRGPMVIPDGVRVTVVPSVRHDPRYQLPPDWTPSAGGFADEWRRLRGQA